MRPAQLAQLQPVLGGPQELVRVGQALRVVPADEAAVAQRRQRRQGGPDLQRGLGPAVYQLQQLYRELDVAQAARAELDLALQLVGRQVCDHPPAHGLGVGDEAGTLRGRPHQRGQRLDVALPQLQVAGERAGLEQRLELPGGRPALVVGLVAVQGAHQRPGASLRPERGVHLPGRLAADPHGVGGEPGGAGQCRGLPVRGPAAGVIGGRFGLGDEHHVDVGDVVQLPATRLAHPDDGQPAAGGVGGQPGPGDREPGRQHEAGQVGQRLGDLPQVQLVGQVAGGHQQQLPAVGRPQRPHRVEPGQGGRPAGGAGHRLGRRGADRFGQPVGGRGHAGQLVGRAAQQQRVVRMGAQVLAECLRGAEHLQQPDPEPLRRAQLGHDLGTWFGAGQHRQQRQRLVGRRGAAERGQHGRRGRVAGLVLLGVPQLQRRAGQQLGGPHRIGEAGPGQPGGQPAGGRRRWAVLSARTAHAKPAARPPGLPGWRPDR